MKRSWRNSFILLLTCFIGCLVLLIYPLYVIRPFRRQGTTELSVALEMMRIRTAVAVPIAALAVVLGLVAWRHTSRLIARAGLVVLMVLTVICGALSFVNVYELMFNPLRRPTFKETSQTRLDGNEQVIAVKLARSARAYPIRVISYHHIVNDVLAGFPVVATY
jgi:Protein of unknown function (DUF3179)